MIIGKGKLRANQPGYKRSLDKNGKTIWVPDGNYTDDDVGISVNTLRSDFVGEDYFSTKKMEELFNDAQDCFKDLDDEYCTIKHDGDIYSIEDFSSLYAESVAYDNDSPDEYNFLVVLNVSNPDNTVNKANIRSFRNYDFPEGTDIDDNKMTITIPFDSVEDFKNKKDDLEKVFADCKSINEDIPIINNDDYQIEVDNQIREYIDYNWFNDLRSYKDEKLEEYLNSLGLEEGSREYEDAWSTKYDEFEEKYDIDKLKEDVLNNPSKYASDYDYSGFNIEDIDSRIAFDKFFFIK